MITQDQLRNVVGAPAYDPSGDKIGEIGRVYYDHDTDQPKWVTVATGLFGTNESSVPVRAPKWLVTGSPWPMTRHHRPTRNTPRGGAGG